MDKNVNFPNIKHETLGELRYNTKFNCYESKVVLDETQLYFHLLIEDKVELILNRASSIVQHLKHYAKKAEEYAAKELLELKNEAWLDEGETFITDEEFQNRMRLEGLAFSSNGEVEFYYDEEEIFWGHGILVKMDKDNCFIYANIFG